MQQYQDLFMHRRIYFSNTLKLRDHHNALGWGTPVKTGPSVVTSYIINVMFNAFHIAHLSSSAFILNASLYLVFKHPVALLYLKLFMYYTVRQ
jgi:hypothetical protein